MIYGYARTSTFDQHYGLEDQIAQQQSWVRKGVQRAGVSNGYGRPY